MKNSIYIYFRVHMESSRSYSSVPQNQDSILKIKEDAKSDSPPDVARLQSRIRKVVKEWQSATVKDYETLSDIKEAIKLTNELKMKPWRSDPQDSCFTRIAKICKRNFSFSIFGDRYGRTRSFFEDAKRVVLSEKKERINEIKDLKNAMVIAIKHRTDLGNQEEAALLLKVEDQEQLSIDEISSSKARDLDKTSNEEMEVWKKQLKTLLKDPLLKIVDEICSKQEETRGWTSIETSDLLKAIQVFSKERYSSISEKFNQLIRQVQSCKESLLQTEGSNGVADLETAEAELLKIRTEIISELTEFFKEQGIEVEEEECVDQTVVQDLISDFNAISVQLPEFDTPIQGLRGEELEAAKRAKLAPLGAFAERLLLRGDLPKKFQGRLTDILEVLFNHAGNIDRDALTPEGLMEQRMLVRRQIGMFLVDNFQS